MKEMMKTISVVVAAALCLLATGVVVLLFLCAAIGASVDPAGGGSPDTLGLDTWQATLLLALVADGPLLVLAGISGAVAWRGRQRLVCLWQRRKKSHNHTSEGIRQPADGLAKPSM